MKSIKDILKKKKSFSGDGVQIKDGDKAVIKISQIAILSEIKNLSPEDIRDIFYGKNKLVIKTIHPAVASEIWRKRERIINQVNREIGKDIIFQISVK
ncbi:MAG: hypothetical protein WC831_04190 [Parcubacteria group bacterium]|jgi:hypothetical protein